MTTIDQAFDEGLPPGYRTRRDGWIEIARKAEGENVWRALCSPLRIIARTRDGRSRNWGFLIECVDADGVNHRWAEPAEVFVRDSREALGTLVRNGLRIASDRGAGDEVVRFITAARPGARVTVTDRLGWSETGRSFVLAADRVIGPEAFVLQAAGPSPLAREMRAGGGLETWREKVAALATGNPILVLAISTAFAGPLLAPLGQEGGGLHLRGASSRGKTSALRAAASVWGAPGFVNSWRATANALEGLASGANDTLLALDELGEVAPRAAAEAVYMIANGVGKSRATARGAAIQPARWRIMLLSSGEIGLGDKLAEEKSRLRAGQAVRFLEIAATDRAHGAFDDLHGFAAPAALADAIKAATADSFGVAGPEFVAAWFRDPESAETRARRLMLEIEARARSTLSSTHVDGQVGRALGRFALIGAAGDLATDFGLTGWRLGEAGDAALLAFGAWVAERGCGGDSFEALDVIARLRRFIEAHGAARFERLRAPGDSSAREMIRDRAGYVDPESYWINEAAWVEIFATHDAQRAAQLLKDRGFLICGEIGRLKSKLPKSVDGARGRAYRVSAAVLEAEG